MDYLQLCILNINIHECQPLVLVKQNTVFRLKILAEEQIDGGIRNKQDLCNISS